MKQITGARFYRGLPARAAAFLLSLCVGSLWAGDITVTVNDETGKPLTDAVVYLDSSAAKAASKALGGVEIGQQDRKFIPAVTVVPVGSSITFPNRDTVRHHVYSFSPAKTFDLKLYSGTPSSPVVFDKPGVVNLGCNIHDQMQAWVVVVETPFHGKSERGVATLHAVPAGTYRLKVWHPRLAANAPMWEQAITVGAPAQQLSVVLKGLDS